MPQNKKPSSENNKKPLQLGLLDMLIPPQDNTAVSVEEKTENSFSEKVSGHETGRSDNKPQAETPRIFTVEELIAAVNTEFRKNYFGIWVEGEISDIRGKGRVIYLTLKGAGGGVLNCNILLWKYRPSFELTEGLKVKMRGYLDIYAPRGSLAFTIDFIEPFGMGDLAVQFELLKKKLEKEGIFDDKHKKTLPRFPKTVGIVTSKEAAALRDILKVFRKRIGCRVIISPSLVQGKNAPAEIVRAIKRLDKRGDIDVIICARGGGSAEDLSCFNDESVVRAIYEAETPVITGVGHQIDFTLADFAADKRAATPTEAAEIVFPETEAVKELLQNKAAQIAKFVNMKINEYALFIAALKQRLVTPDAYIERQAKLLNEKAYLLENLLKRILQSKENQLAGLKNQVSYFRPSEILNEKQKNLALITDRLVRLEERKINDVTSELSTLKAKLLALDPMSVLKRGYALVTDEENKVITSVNQVSAGETLQIALSDGNIKSEIKETTVK